MTAEQRRAPGEPFGAFFLTAPERFTDDPDGQPWGEHEVELDLPGGPYLLTGVSALQRERLERRYEGYARPPGRAPGACTIRALRALPSEFLAHEHDLDGWTYWIDFDHLPDRVRLAGLGFAGAFLRAGRLADAVLRVGIEDGPDVLPIFENFLRPLVAHRVLERGGALLHSAGIVDGGRAFVFFGASGAGKSTLSRAAFAAGRDVLSDDLNAVLPGRSGFEVARIPFAGDLACAGAVRLFPLGGLLRLAKGPDLGVARLSGPVALASLLAASPFANLDPHRLPALVEVLTRLASETRIDELFVPLGVDFARVANLLDR